MAVTQYTRTNLFVVDEELYKWAKYRADLLGFKSVSEYIFSLIRRDKEVFEAEV